MRRFALLWVVLGALFAQAQDKVLTISEAISGRGLYPQGIYQLKFAGNDLYSRLVLSEEGNNYEVRDVKSDVLQLSFGLDLLNRVLAEAKLDSLERLPSIDWLNAKTIGFKNGEDYVAVDVYQEKAERRFNFKKGVGEIVYTADHKGYAGTIEDGLAYSVGKHYGQLTDVTNGIEIGRTVHRSEFGIHNGLFFSPDGSKLAYYYMNESMVSEYPLYNMAGTPGGADMIRYPTAGKASHHVTLRIRTTQEDKPDVIINVEGPKEQYLTNVSWTPDNTHVLIALVNRAQDHMWLNKYDATTGAFVATLFEESHDKYIEPEHPAEFLAHDPTKFVWWSERDGYDHLYLYNADGGLVKQMTKGPWVVTDFYGFNAEGTKFFIRATKESAIERHLYCVDLKSGKMKRLTDEAGTHHIIPNADNSYFFDIFSSLDVPRSYSIIDEKGKTINSMLRSEDPRTDLQPVDIEIGTITGVSGDELFYRVFKPADMEAGKKYPAVVYLYNGPHAQLISNSYLGGANFWYYYMAQKGYVVYTIEGRGSANRGRDFENAIFRNCGSAEMEDQLTGLKWLKSQSYIDSSRVGIHGWSYGGFMTISLMTRTPGNYKVGVAGGPVIDWSLYEVMYTERYMDQPEENLEGYKATDLKNYVTNLEGDLLVIHGAQDNVVLWEHSLEYLQKCITSGVQVDYFVYPHHEHNVIGRDRIHLYEKVSNYFFDKL